MTDLSDLIERVRAATGADRVIDSDLSWFFSDWENLGGGWIQHKTTGERERTSYPAPEPVTASIDAAIGLAERVLPGWAWKIGTCSVSDDAWLVPDFNCPIHGERLKEQLGYPNNVAPGSIFDAGIDVDRRPSGQPALAMCEATLLAVQATGAK